MSKVWTKVEIKALLEKNPAAVERGVVAIFKLQTVDEQVVGNTKHYNGVGFNATDAPIMTSFAKWVLSGKHLTPKQFAIAKKKIMKYVGQLVKIANGQLKIAS